MLMQKKEKIALVIEGGGFRCVFTSGVLDAFLINKFNPFNIYIGVSGGAISLSYYACNQYKDVFTMMKKMCVDGNFLSYSRAFSDQGYMNLSYMEKYAKQNNPLDLERIKELKKNKELYFVATNTDNGEAVYLEPNKQNIYRCLRATSSLPFLTKSNCKINGIKLMDGAWSDPIPIKAAIDFGATKIIVLRTFPKDYRISGLNYLGLFAGYWWIKNPKMKNQYSNAVDDLKRRHKNVEIHQICPDDFLNTGLLGVGEDIVIKDYHYGLEKGMDFLNSNFL